MVPSDAQFGHTPTSLLWNLLWHFFKLFCGTWQLFCLQLHCFVCAGKSFGVFFQESDIAQLHLLADMHCQKIRNRGYTSQWGLDDANMSVAENHKSYFLLMLRALPGWPGAFTLSFLQAPSWGNSYCRELWGTRRDELFTSLKVTHTTGAHILWPKHVTWSHPSSWFGEVQSHQTPGRTNGDVW